MKELEYVLGSTEDLRSDVVRFTRQLRRLDERVQFHLLCMRFITEDRLRQRGMGGSGEDKEITPTASSANAKAATSLDPATLLMNSVSPTAPSHMASEGNPPSSPASPSTPVGGRHGSNATATSPTSKKSTLSSSRGGVTRRVTTRAATRQAMEAMMAARRGGEGSHPDGMIAASSSSSLSSSCGALFPSSDSVGRTCTPEEVAGAKKRRRAELCAALQESEASVDPAWQGEEVPGLPSDDDLLAKDAAVLRRLFEDHKRYLQRYLVERNHLAAELNAVAARIHSIVMGERAIGG